MLIVHIGTCSLTSLKPRLMGRCDSVNKGIVTYSRHNLFPLCGNENNLNIA